MWFSKKVSVDSFEWDTTGWERVPDDKGMGIWKSEMGAAAVAILLNEVPVNMVPVDWKNSHSLRQFLERQANPSVCSVSIDVKTLAAGIDSVQMIHKRAMKSPSLGFRYTGMVIIPFEKCSYSINFISEEGGQTGFREAAVTALLIQSGKMERPDPSTVPRVSGEDFIKKMLEARKTPKLLPSDDESWDEQFPDHPLSLVRRYLKRFTTTVKFASEAKKLRLYKN